MKDADFNMRKDFYERSKEYDEEVSTEKRAFGRTLIGEWICLKYGCGYSIYPYHLKKRCDDFKWGKGAEALEEGYVGPICPNCGTPLEYDEAE